MIPLDERMSIRADGAVTIAGHDVRETLNRTRGRLIEVVISEQHADHTAHVLLIPGEVHLLVAPYREDPDPLVRADEAEEIAQYLRRYERRIEKSVAARLPWKTLPAIPPETREYAILRLPLDTLLRSYTPNGPITSTMTFS